MTNTLADDVARDGHLTRIRRLQEMGHPRSSIEDAIRAGDLLHICHSWVGTLLAQQPAVVAVANFGKLTGASALTTDGVWDGDDRRLHVAVRPNAHGTRRQLRIPIASFSTPRFAATGFDRHWSYEVHVERSAPPWRVSLVDALVQVARDLQAEQFVACIESAIHHRKIGSAGLDALFAALPAHMQYLRDWIDPLAQSGLESLARIRIRRFVNQVESQVEVAGINPFGRAGWVDLLLDGWLVVELDGDEFHDPVADRARNGALVRRGYRIHRFGHSQVLRGWPEVEATIRELLRNPPARLPAR